MKRREVFLLSSGHLVTDINQGAVPALLPFLISEHSLSYAAGAGIVFATNISATVVQPFFGHAADRFSNVWLLPVSLLLAGLGISLIGIASNYWLIIFFAAISGIGISAYHPEAARLVFLSSGKQKGFAMSFFGLGGTLGFAVGPLIITYSIIHFNLIGTFTLLFPVTIMATIIIFMMPELNKIHIKSVDSRSHSAANPVQDAWGPFIRLTLTVIGRSILLYGLYTFIPLYWIHGLKQSNIAGGSALSVIAFAGVAGNLIGGKLSDRVDHLKVILTGYLVLIPLLQALMWVEDPTVAMFLLIPIGLALSSTYSPTIVIGQHYLPNHVGFSSGVTLGVTVAIGGIFTPLLGKIADHYGLWSTIAIISIIPFLSAIVTLSLPNMKALSIKYARSYAKQR
jgi:FSR family fosmidomycin resistance protein-like MFS transporter